jgi:hypothetical protein
MADVDHLGHAVFREKLVEQRELVLVSVMSATCSTGETLVYCAAAARATVSSVSPVASETRCK